MRNCLWRLMRVTHWAIRSRLLRSFPYSYRSYKIISSTKVRAASRLQTFKWCQGHRSQNSSVSDQISDRWRYDPFKDRNNNSLLLSSISHTEKQLVVRILCSRNDFVSAVRVCFPALAHTCSRKKIHVCETGAINFHLTKFSSQMWSKNSNLH